MHWCNAMLWVFLFSHTFTLKKKLKARVVVCFIVDGCYIICEVMQKKIAVKKKNLKRIDRVRLLNGWILHKAKYCNAQLKAHGGTRRRWKRWFNTGNLQNSLSAVFLLSRIDFFLELPIHFDHSGRHFECAMCNIKIMCSSRSRMNKKPLMMMMQSLLLLYSPPKKNRNLTKYFLHNSRSISHQYYFEEGNFFKKKLENLVWEVFLSQSLKKLALNSRWSLQPFWDRFFRTFGLRLLWLFNLCGNVSLQLKIVYGGFWNFLKLKNGFFGI